MTRTSLSLFYHPSFHEVSKCRDCLRMGCVHPKTYSHLPKKKKSACSSWFVLSTCSKNTRTQNLCSVSSKSSKSIQRRGHGPSLCSVDNAKFVSQYLMPARLAPAEHIRNASQHYTWRFARLRETERCRTHDLSQ
jgi:hypothetical protein